VICPKCRDEFREGIEACPDCGAELVEELLPEPSQRLLVIETTRDPERLGILLDQLENAQVPYVVEAGTALSLLDDESGPEPSVPDPWEARLRVPAGFAERAAEAIAKAPAPASMDKAAETDEPEEVETLDAADLKKPVQPR
jgi:hypothetical protein